jgi:DNA-binding CsgD family transcriptional regulator
LHDVGRTAISLQIWNKPGPLTSAEWERVRLYPYYTERILTRAPLLKPVGIVASQHRERLDGSGFHRGLEGEMLTPSARLLAAADVYQSKREPRAYRAILEPDVAAKELQNHVREGKLDRIAVEAVLACGRPGNPTRATYPAGLSEREVEVLQLLAMGSTYRQIAQCLHISFKTVDRHVQNIYTKIGVSTRSAATLFAIHHDMATPQASQFWR